MNAEIWVTVIHATKNAVLVESNEIEVWLPLSQIEDIDLDSTESQEIEIPEWLAEDKELI